MSGNYDSIMSKIADHPCYSKEAHHTFSRIHLPVAPACNIQCNYCNRKYDCSNESRPGVTTEKLKPLEGLKKVLKVGSEIKQLSVVGIAGPGDALANPKKTFETLELIKQYAPDLRLCISTNGLQLPNYVDELYNIGVDHVTVTINTIDPKVGAKIYPWVYFEGVRYKGEEGAALLLKRQLEGIEKAVAKGMLIKANSVLIPGINEEGMPDVAAKLKEMGVFLHNIMPLLSEPEFGTVFGLTGVPSATTEQLNDARKACGQEMQQMEHCHQCRADAVGLLGEDRSAEFTKSVFENADLEELVKAYDLPARQKFKKSAELFQASLIEYKHKNDCKIAVTSFDRESVDIHFGSATDFLIYEVFENKVRLLEIRKPSYSYCSGPENCSADNPIEEIAQTISDCKYLITAKIGDCPKKELDKIGIEIHQEFANLNNKDAINLLLNIAPSEGGGSCGSGCGSKTEQKSDARSGASAKA